MLFKSQASQSDVRRLVAVLSSFSTCTRCTLLDLASSTSLQLCWSSVSAVGIQERTLRDTFNRLLLIGA